MSRLTLDLPAELQAIVEGHPEVHWKGLAEKAIWSYALRLQLADRIASRSRLRRQVADSIGRLVKRGLRRRYAKPLR